MKQITKSDIKDYMKVVQRNKSEYIKRGNEIDLFNEDLTSMYRDKFDIMEVYEPTLDGWRLLWKREEHKYMLLFPKEMYREGYSLITNKQGTYQPYPVAYDIEPNTKCTFTQKEINAIPFNTDIFTKVETDK